MAALGDSITRGMNACAGRLGECPEDSWATGTDPGVPSHAQRLPAAATVSNLASSGARVRDLPGQADAAAALRPAYVTILIGANDACRSNPDAMTGVAEFAEAYRAALATLKRSAPEAKLLVVSVPDLYQLWRVGHTDARAVRVWGLGVCQAMLAAPTSTAPADEARRLRVRERVSGYNAVIAAECARYGPRCRGDAGEAFRFAFRPEHVSTVDYFHPSAAGQAELARLTNSVGYGW